LEIREFILKERGMLCECCGTRQWTELHHCLVHDSKRLHKQVTVPENLMAVCRNCHPYLNGHEVRKRFAMKQLERGYDIALWYNNLNMKIKEAWILNISKE
jgi:ribosomal protein L32